ncbi:DUF1302 family protein [Sulfurovum sp.]|uniref:DUF1302 family protein n=1 Tax=Sulfurovum sp. TaxID=1969726 RepID=UPI0028681D7C|nr:DUF1302 family protein [Sulfurovum sp.]
MITFLQLDVWKKGCSFMRVSSNTLLILSLFTVLNADTVDADLAGFDDTPVIEVEKETTEDVMDGFDDAVDSTDDTSSASDEMMSGFEDEVPGAVEEEKTDLIPGLTGKITEQIAFSWNNDEPHDNFTSVKSSLLLDYDHKFENGVRVKVNAKAYYDAIYSMKGREKFTSQELDELESEVELFDAYVEGKITDNFDYKVGRQVVVWGRSDTIRVTDILNPLDNRRPGMTDIEDLRLPVTMAKFDYFIGDWRITPIAVLEQRFSKNPPYGGDFNPVHVPAPSNEEYHDVTYALSIGAEYSGWDINFYAAQTRDDAGYIDLTDTDKRVQHDKVKMVGTALNILSGSWLFKTEVAYFDGLKYTTTGDDEFSRTDALVGVEYNGIADTLMSYDIVSRQIHDYDGRLLAEFNPLDKHHYQHAFRVSSDFLNATLTANYLISLYGEKLDEGGFQRAWLKYELADGINANVGVVDYIGGSVLFDAFKDNDMVFADISYNF